MFYIPKGTEHAFVLDEESKLLTMNFQPGFENYFVELGTPVSEYGLPSESGRPKTNSLRLPRPQNATAWKSLVRLPELIRFSLDPVVPRRADYDLYTSSHPVSVRSSDTHFDITSER